MKKILTLVCLLTAPLLAMAQDTGTQTTALPAGKFREKLQQRLLKGLSPEERSQFEAARKKALEDPKIAELKSRAEAANREFFSAMREKMKEIDPSLEAALDASMKEKAGAGTDKKARGEDREGHKGMAQLTEEERQKLKAAREKAKTTPAVQQAENERAAAKTPEERRQASEKYGQAMSAAILAADPSLQGVLEKIRPHHHGAREKGDAQE